MKTNVTRIIAAITQNRSSATLLGVGALALIGGLATGPAPGKAEAAEPAAKTIATAPDGSAAAPKAAPAPAAKQAPVLPTQNWLQHDFQYQPNYYYCGPAATRIALSAHGKKLSQDAIAAMLGTTVNGTDSAFNVTAVLNQQLGKGRYHTTEIPGQAATASQINQLRIDVMTAINQGDPVVANVAGTMRDTAGEVHSYEGGHYLTVTGYKANGSIVRIADPADTVGGNEYNMTTATLADWIATRGYSS